MRWSGAVGSLLLALGCGNIEQAESVFTPPMWASGSEGSAAGESGDDGDSSDDGNVGQAGIAEGDGSDSGTGTGEPGAGGPSDAHFAGKYDGDYTGTVTIEFTPGGACSGQVTITVDSTADPQIVGTGECTGQVVDGVNGGSTDIDGVIAFDGPSGHARQLLDGSIVDVGWDGLFYDTSFDGDFTGTFTVNMIPLDFVGHWTVDRQ